MQKFNYHQHTYRCGHADNDTSDEDYVLEYRKMGLKKIAFTDHCPEKNRIDKRTHMRMEYSQKDEYLNSVKFLKEKYADKIEIQSGYEVEYLPGEEKNLMELKNEVDKIILGQHFIYDKDNNLKIINKHEYTDSDLIKYAEYIKKAIELKIPNIIAHPDFFMLGRSDFGDTEKEVAYIIFKSAQKNNIPLEINLNDIFKNVYYENEQIGILPIKQQKEKLKCIKYPCKEFWKIATEHNVNVIYGLDVHHKGQILLFNELVKLAEESLGEEIIKNLNFINY